MNHSKDLVQRAKAEVFKNKEDVEVIAAVEALGDLRVVIISGEWDTPTSRIKLGLFNCHMAAGRLQVKRGYALGGLKKVTAVINDGTAQVFALGLTFGGSTGRETDLTFQAKKEETIFQLLCPLWHFVTKWRQSDSKAPELIGLPERRGHIINHITDWNARFLDQSIERRLTSRQLGGAEDNAQPEEGAVEEDDDAENSSIGISAKEGKEISQLLSKFEYEVGEIGDFQSKVQQELFSLQAANVQTILDSTVQVAKVRDSLFDALALLDDVSENLATFDYKIKNMRDDISAIEERNNQLELQTRNNGKLLDCLDRLLDKMQLSSDTERKLRQMSFGSRNREAMIEAGWELYDHLHSLGESVKDSKATSDLGSYGIANMTSVADQRARFSALTKSYVEHAAEYIGVELTNKTTHFMQTELIGRDSDGRIRIQDHSQLHQDIENLTTLVHVARTAHPPIIKTIGLQYTHAFNALLQKELRGYTAGLRKGIMTSINNLQSDLTMLKGTSRGKDELISVESMAEKKQSLQARASLRKNLELKRKDTEITLKAPEAFKISEAWSQLLQDWVPFLLSELDQCAEFLNFKEDDIQLTQDLNAENAEEHEDKGNGLKQGDFPNGTLKSARLSAIGVAALEALLVNLSEDFFTIVDIVEKQQHFQAIPMLSLTLQWQAKIKSLPLSSHLFALLHQCAQRLLTSYQQCVSEMERMLVKFESKLTYKDGLKHIHVLPFVESFPNLVAYLHELMHTSLASKPTMKVKPAEDEVEEDLGTNDILEGEDDFEAREEEDLFPESSMLVNEQGNFWKGVAKAGRNGLARISAQQPRRPSLNLPRGGPGPQPGPSIQKPEIAPAQLQRSSGKALVIGRPILEGSSIGEDRDGSLRQLTEAELPERIPELRLIQSAKDAVDPTIVILSRAIFASVEAISLRDTKHGERVKMENYLAFAELLREAAEKNAILDYFVRDADDRADEAIEDYIQQQMEYAKVWRLVDFSQGVDHMLLQVGQEEVTFQTGFQAADYQSMLATTINSGLQKRLTVIKARIIKHMERDYDLMERVWLRFQEKLEDSYRRLFNVSEALYPTVVPMLTPDELVNMFNVIDGQAPTS